MCIEVNQRKNPLPDAQAALGVMIDDNGLVELLGGLCRDVENTADPSMSAGTESLVSRDEGAVEDRDPITEKITEVMHRLDGAIGGLDHVKDILVCELCDLRRTKVDAGRVVRIVIEHERQIHRLADAAIMLDDRGLGWLLKIRQDHNDAVCAAL